MMTMGICAFHMGKICEDRIIPKEPKLSYSCDGSYVTEWNPGGGKLLIKNLEYQTPELSCPIGLDWIRLHKEQWCLWIIWKMWAIKTSHRFVKLMNH